MARRKHHHVYVIELHKDVLLEPRFRKNNPGYVDGKPCVYVGVATAWTRMCASTNTKPASRPTASPSNTACACYPTCLKASTP